MVIMSWTDKRLRWKLHDYGYTKSIRADQNQVWIPDVEVLNRLHDFSPFDEKASRVHVYYDGRVVNTRYVQAYKLIKTLFRMFRLRANFSPSVNTYPYDLQIAAFSIASTDYSMSKVKVDTLDFSHKIIISVQITTNTWDSLNKIKKPDYTYQWDDAPSGTEKWLFTDESRKIIEHELLVSNAEWRFIGYKYKVQSLASTVREDFSTLQVKIGLKRNSSYYSLTLFVPIMVLTVLTPVGMIMPIEAGEKIGYQITLLLTMVIYVEYLQTRVPVFDSLSQTPHLLTYFVVIIILLCIELLSKSLFNSTEKQFSNNAYALSLSCQLLRIEKLFQVRGRDQRCNGKNLQHTSIWTLEVRCAFNGSKNC